MEQNKINEPKNMEVIKGNFSLVPQTFEEAEKYSAKIAESSICPEIWKKKPTDVFVAMQMGMDLGLSPMQSIQNIYVINGRPSIFGDIGKAILLNGGCKIYMPDLAEVAKTGSATVKITRQGFPDTQQTFTKEMAIRAKLWEKAGPWTSYPERQLSWRAFWFAARDIAADLLKGLNGAEEIADIDFAELIQTPKNAVGLDPQIIPTPKRKSEKIKEPIAAVPQVEPAVPQKQEIPAEEEPKAEEPKKEIPPIPTPEKQKNLTVTVGIKSVVPKEYKKADDTIGTRYVITSTGDQVFTTFYPEKAKIAEEIKSNGEVAEISYVVSEKYGNGLASIKSLGDSAETDDERM